MFSLLFLLYDEHSQNNREREKRKSHNQNQVDWQGLDDGQVGIIGDMVNNPTTNKLEIIHSFNENHSIIHSFNENHSFIHSMKIIQSFIQ